jgi:hypothetical protein
MTHIEDLSLDEIVRFVQQKFNVRLNIDTFTPANTPVTPSYQGTSSEFSRNSPTVVTSAPPAPPPPPQTVKGGINLKQPTNDFRQPLPQRSMVTNVPPRTQQQQGFAPQPTQSFNPKNSWTSQPQQPPPRQNVPPPQQNFAPPVQQRNIPPKQETFQQQKFAPAPQQQPQQPQQQQQQQGMMGTNNLPPVSFYQKTPNAPPQQQSVPNLAPRQPVTTTQPVKQQQTIAPPKTNVPTTGTTTTNNVVSGNQTTNTTTTARKGSVLDRWSGFQNQPKISPGMEEALRLTAHVSVKERREEIERLMKAVESKFTDNDFTKIAAEVQQSQQQSMMKSITQQGGNQQDGSNVQGGGQYGQGGMQQQGGIGQQQQQGGSYSARQDEEEPSMLNIPDTLLYALQINTILQLLAMRQWKQAKQNLRNLQPYVQQGTKEDIFVRIVWSVYYNNYGVDLANQNNFRKAATKAQKGQSMAETIGLQSFRYIDHEYSYWAVLLNTSAILAQAMHREGRHMDCARIHANAQQALIGVQRTTNPNSIGTMNKTKMYAVNAIIFGIHAQDKSLLSSGVDLLFPLVQYDAQLRPLLGHGYKNIGILELRAGNSDNARGWFDAAMSLV